MVTYSKRFMLPYGKRFMLPYCKTFKLIYVKRFYVGEQSIFTYYRIFLIIKHDSLHKTLQCIYGVQVQTYNKLVGRYDYIPVAIHKLLYFTVAPKATEFTMVHFPSYIMQLEYDKNMWMCIPRDMRILVAISVCYYA